MGIMLATVFRMVALDNAKYMKEELSVGPTILGHDYDSDCVMNQFQLITVRRFYG